MINQFDGESFVGLVIVNPNVGEMMVGTVQGTKYLEAQALPREQWTSSNHDIMVFDCIMLFVFAFVLDMIGLHFQEKTRQWYFQQIRRPRAHVRRKDISEDPEAQGGLGSMNQDHTIESLSVKNLCYSVKVGKKSSSTDLVLLNGITARFRSGRMCALMGQSG